MGSCTFPALEGLLDTEGVAAAVLVELLVVDVEVLVELAVVLVALSVELADAESVALAVAAEAGITVVEPFCTIVSPPETCGPPPMLLGQTPSVQPEPLIWPVLPGAF